MLNDMGLLNANVNKSVPADFDRGAIERIIDSSSAPARELNNNESFKREAYNVLVSINTSQTFHCPLI